MPSMRLIADVYKNSTASSEQYVNWSTPIGSLAIISEPSHSFKPESIEAKALVVISYNSVKRLKALLEDNLSRDVNQRISGILLTCAVNEERISQLNDQFLGYPTPVIITSDDTSLTDEKIYNIIKNTKLQQFDVDKFEKIKDSFDRYFDTEKFLRSIGIS